MVLYLFMVLGFRGFAFFVGFIADGSHEDDECLVLCT